MACQAASTGGIFAAKSPAVGAMTASLYAIATPAYSWQNAAVSGSSGAGGGSTGGLVEARAEGSVEGVVDGVSGSGVVCSAGGVGVAVRVVAAVGSSSSPTTPDSARAPKTTPSRRITATGMIQTRLFF